MQPRIVVAAFSFAFGDDGVERGTPGGAPTAFRIWRAGANATDMGVHVFSPDSAKALMAEQAVRGNLYSIDADHMSLNASSPPESRKAVGWHRLAVRDSADGPELWAVDVQWTDAVRAGLEKSPPEWRYFSPAYKLSKEGNVITSYLNTALTNNPATHSVTALARLQAASRTGMDYKEMAAAMFGSDEDKKKEAKECYSKMSEAERKAYKAAWKAASEHMAAEGGEGEEGGDDEKKKKDEEAKAAKAKEAAEAAKKASEAEAEKKKEEATRATATLEELRTLAFNNAKEMHELKAAAAARAESDARATMLATRPDFSDAIKTTLAKLPLAQVEEAVKTWPKTTTRLAHAAASAKVVGTRGEGQTAEDVSDLTPAEDAYIARRMGMSVEGTGVKRAGRNLELGPMTPAQASAFLATRAKDNAAAAKVAAGGK